jgi:hypothetical protein
MTKRNKAKLQILLLSAIALIYTVAFYIENAWCRL